MPDHHEIERTWSPPADAPLPDLSALPGVAAVGPARILDLHATYLDTRDLRLTRAGVTLRRRTGGADEGWHLKVPAGLGRDELHRRLGTSPTTPPASLDLAVLGFTRGLPLEPVATIATLRTAYDLLDADGAVLAELADDVVAASSTRGGVVETVEWREWELELVGAEPRLLTAATRLLAGQGIEAAAVPRKIEAALAERLPAPTVLPTPKPGKPGSRAVHAYLAEQVRELVLQDARIRRSGSGDGVHRLRIAARRLRSALRAYRPLLDRDVTEPLRAELRWAGRGLADLRDSHVVHTRLRRLVDDEPRSVVVGPVRRRLAATYRLRGRDGLREARELLTSQRYLDLLDGLDLLVTDPPWTDRAERRADRELPRHVARQWQRLQAVHEELLVAEAADAVQEAEVLRHDVRKGAKRLRYAAEVARPVRGKDARRVVRAAKALTSVLGEIQDTVASRVDLLEISRHAGADGENAFTYGRLHAREEARAAALEADIDAAWSALARAMRRW